MSYVQFARKGLELQKTQIKKSHNNSSLLTRLTGSAGSFDVGYHRYGSLVKTADKEQTFFDSVHVSMEGIATLASSDRGSLREALNGIDARVSLAAEAFSARCA